MNLADLGNISRRCIDEGFFAGAVLRVERASRGKIPGSLLLEEAWGDARLAGTDRVPMSTTTIFDLASLSKLFTATAILRLATTGELRLDSKAADLITPGRLAVGPHGFGDPQASRNFDAILDETVRERLAAGLGNADIASLLTHSSGIHYWYPFYTRRGEAFEAILADVLEAHPRRDEVVYSDLNFMILGRIVERVAGLDLPAAMDALVFSPLRLSRTSYRGPLGPAASGEFGNRIERGMVDALGLGFDGWRDESVPIRDGCNDGNGCYYFGGAAGHAGIFSDARDLCRLGRLYLEDGRLGDRDGKNWLSPDLVGEAMRDHGGNRGLGFQLGPNYPGGGAGHTGFTGTYLHLNAPTKLVIAILTNRLHVRNPRDVNPFRQELSRAVLSVFG